MFLSDMIGAARIEEVQMELSQCSNASYVLPVSSAGSVLLLRTDEVSSELRAILDSIAHNKILVSTDEDSKCSC